MHLKSITIKGFKSFPNRTKLEFSPGVGVIVGPNGSGKSNVTDAVLWALGEQSPLAVRGQTMKDVIFAGGHGIKGSSSAEVEVVIDNEGSGTSEFSEISILRKLDRDGEGEYRLNGARCRLADVAEVLSDTGLGKEMHSVVSQGRVESIVLSRPRERRMLIEEAAGLGKHRKRRRRAQLKLERTGENLSRALDVEREARSRLRPLKRQAEAAQLHERLERQTAEARWELARDDVRAARERLAVAEEEATAARAAQQEAEGKLSEVAKKREAAEERLATQGREREFESRRVYAGRNAAESIALRRERSADQARAAIEGAERRTAQAELLEQELAAAGDPTEGTAERIATLEAELAKLDDRREERLAEVIVEQENERDAAAAKHAELAAAVEVARKALGEAEQGAEAARAARREAEKGAEAARAEAARAGAELARVNHFLRAAEAPGDLTALSDRIEVEAGYETAVAAALGPRLTAGVVASVGDGERVLDDAGEDGGLVLVGSGGTDGPGRPPLDTAEPLSEHVTPADDVRGVVASLLANVWLVDDLAAVPADFMGIAVTKGGRVWRPGAGELRQAPAGGSERVLEQRNRRAELAEASAAAVSAEHEAREAVEAADGAVATADAARDDADQAVRAAQRAAEEAAEEVSRQEWLIDRRRQAPEDGPDAVRRAELAAEVKAERRVADAALKEHEDRAARAAALRARIERDRGLATAAEAAERALGAAAEAVAAQLERFEEAHRAGAETGNELAAALRALAHEEAEIQAVLRAAADRVTKAEVAAQQVRDAAAEHEATLRELAGQLGLEPAAADEELDEERRTELEVRIDRLARRREQLGPVNPLAAKEYEEAVAHVDELETQRKDLEGALAELEGIIRDTDKRIRESFEETFEAAAKNFEDVVAHLFPGGRGKLRLVKPDQTPRPVIGGEAAPEDSEEPPTEVPEAEPGVEIEVTPAGKSTKRLSLMSGGEKSLVALAFMFAVFLARPCPFYILDEVEAALDDLNIDRFLQLVRRYSDRAQFIVVTHQKRTMDAADCLYGVSMGGDGVSRVVSRKLGGQAGDGMAAGAEDDARVA